MEKNTVKNFVISKKTEDMLVLLHEFVSFQERCISMFEDKKGGEDVISATSELYDKMQDTIAASIRETLTDTGIHEL